jgi:putative addiction module component (TIGR02574 family)
MSDELLSAVLALPPSQRAELAHKLLQSLEPESSPEVQEAWADELVRRARELESGTVKAVPWPEARAEILGQLEKRRAGRASS